MIRRHVFAVILYLVILAAPALAYDPSNKPALPIRLDIQKPEREFKIQFAAGTTPRIRSYFLDGGQAWTNIAGYTGVFYFAESMTGTWVVATVSTNVVVDQGFMDFDFPATNTLTTGVFFAQVVVQTPDASILQWGPGQLTIKGSPGTTGAGLIPLTGGDWVLKAGDAMSGPLDMTSNRIDNFDDFSWHIYGNEKMYVSNAVIYWHGDDYNGPVIDMNQGVLYGDENLGTVEWAAETLRDLAGNSALQWGPTTRVLRDATERVALNWTAGLAVYTNFIPNVGSNVSLGSLAKPFKDLYLDTNSLYLGAEALTKSDLVALKALTNAAGGFPVETNHLFVAKWGDDTSAGITRDTPIQSITNAARILQAGPARTATNPVTVTVLDSGSYGTFFNFQDYWTMPDFVNLDAPFATFAGALMPGNGSTIRFGYIKPTNSVIAGLCLKNGVTSMIYGAEIWQTNISGYAIGDPGGGSGPSRYMIDVESIGGDGAVYHNSLVANSDIYIQTRRAEVFSQNQPVFRLGATNTRLTASAGACYAPTNSGSSASLWEYGAADVHLTIRAGYVQTYYLIKESPAYEKCSVFLDIGQLDFYNTYIGSGTPWSNATVSIGSLVQHGSPSGPKPMFQVWKTNGPDVVASLDADGDFETKGRVVATPTFGGFWFNSEAGGTIFTLSSSYQSITNWGAGPTNTAEFTGPYNLQTSEGIIWIPTSATYEVTFNNGFEGTAADPSEQYFFAAFDGSTELQHLKTTRKTANNDVGSCGFSGPAYLTNGTPLTIRAKVGDGAGDFEPITTSFFVRRLN